MVYFNGVQCLKNTEMMLNSTLSQYTMSKMYRIMLDGVLSVYNVLDIQCAYCHSVQCLRICMQR